LANKVFVVVVRSGFYSLFKVHSYTLCTVKPVIKVMVILYLKYSDPLLPLDMNTVQLQCIVRIAGQKIVKALRVH
jgi:hypothetical protein